MVQLLIFNGAHVDATTIVDAKEITVLHLALESRNLLIALTLRAFGTKRRDPNWLSDNETSAGEWVKDKAWSQKINERLGTWSPEKMLIPENDVHPIELTQFVTANNGVNSPAMLFWAAKENKANLVEYLLDVSKETGDLTGPRDDRGWTPLHHAAHLGYEAMVVNLVEEGANINTRATEHGWTALHLAAASGHQGAVEALLSCGADIFAKTDSGDDAMKLAGKGDIATNAGILRALDSNRHKILDDGEGVLKTRDEALRGPPKSESSGERGALPSESKYDADTTGVDVGSEDRVGDSGGFDGKVMSLPKEGEFSQFKAFDRLCSTVQNEQNFRFQESDERVKVAILDTGLDLTHRDWREARIVRFQDSESPVRETGEPRQWVRIMDLKNFFGPPGTEADVMDTHGHGTQVAGIILRLAPRAEVYIARISEKGRLSPGPVAKAIDWAIEQGVDLINMSCGFTSSHGVVVDALRAKEKRIVVFAAMSNDGNDEPAAWPARELKLAIGIHSCKPGGTKASDFTPPPVPCNYNFMVIGQDIVTHWPEAKGGGFRLADGTSFATPVATAMAALVFAFVRQTQCKKDRKETETLFRLEEILETEGMAKVLDRISNVAGEYKYIHPGLLWKDFKPTVQILDVQDTSEARQKHAWRVVREALS